VEKFAHFLQEGHYIMVVDAYTEQETNTVHTVVEHHPNAKLTNMPDTLHK
jgi:hypothetical protein